MKKFKKVMAMSCAAIMAVSAMSVSAFAASDEIYALSRDETMSRGFIVIDEDIYDLNGNMLIDMNDGFTPDGYTLDPEFRVAVDNSVEKKNIVPYSTNIASGTFTLNLNTTGNESIQIGRTFELTASEPDVYVQYKSGSAAAVNFGLVNITRNTMVEWVPSVKPGKDDYLHGYASNDEWKLVASAQNVAGNAKIIARTANDN